MADTEQNSKTIGELGEDFVAWLCEQPFARDFVFVRPIYARGKHQRELCDVFILFDDTAIIVQVKTPDPNAHAGWSDDREAVWANKKVREAVNQIGGALNAILKGLITEVNNTRQGAVPLCVDRLRHFYGLAVVHHPPLDRYGGSPIVESEGRKCSVLKATITELSSIFEELTTIGDFVDYMRARDRFFEKNVMVGITELDVLATYKPDPEKFEENVDRYDMIFIEPGIWDEFSAKAKRAARDRANVPSQIVDAMIDMLHTGQRHEPLHFDDPHRAVGTTDAVRGDYVEIANELARLRRLDRRNVGLKLIEKSTKCIDENRDRHFVSYVLDDRSSGILFLISTSSRAERCRSLLGLMLAAKLKLGARRIVGIVTEPVESPKRSIDACVLELDPQLENNTDLMAMRKDADHLFKQSSNGDEFEFPQ